MSKVHLPPPPPSLFFPSELKSLSTGGFISQESVKLWGAYRGLFSGPFLLFPTLLLCRDSPQRHDGRSHTVSRPFLEFGSGCQVALWFLFSIKHSEHQASREVLCFRQAQPVRPLLVTPKMCVWHTGNLLPGVSCPA